MQKQLQAFGKVVALHKNFIAHVIRPNQQDVRQILRIVFVAGEGLLRVHDVRRKFFCRVVKSFQRVGHEQIVSVREKNIFAARKF